MARGGMRRRARQQAACEPGGCGAQPGQPCVAYVQKKGKTTGKPTADVYAARWRAFRARQRARVTEREEKVMGERDEWANGAEGYTAIQEARAVARQRGISEEIADGGITQDDITAILWAGREVSERFAEREATESEQPQEADAPGHDHRWLLLGVQESVPPFTPLGRPQPHTAVLVRCRACGLPDALLLPGTWSLADMMKSGYPL